MSNRTNFEHEEWITLRAVMRKLMFNIVLSDNEVHNFEVAAWRGEIEALADSATPLVQELLKADQDRDEDENAAVQDKAESTDLKALLDEALPILETKASPEELLDYKKSLMALVAVVAEAAPGGDEEENEVITILNDRLWGG